MKIEKKEYIEYTIEGKYVPDYSKKFVKIGDLVVIERLEDGYYDIYLVAQTDYDKVQLIGLKSANRWNDGIDYDWDTGVSIEDLVESKNKNIRYFALKKVKE